MRNFQKRGKIRQLVESKYFLIFLGILIFVFIFNMFSFIEKMLDTYKNKKIALEKVQELEKSREKFNSEIERLNTEKGIEENLREKFGVGKEGENMILIVEEKTEKNIEKTEDSYGFFSFLKDLFK